MWPKILIFLLLITPVHAFRGDLNNDNELTIQDLTLAVANFRTYDTNRDVNRDGRVDLVDLVLMVRNFGVTACFFNCTPSLLSITLINESAGRVDWSYANDLLAYDALGEDGYYDIYVSESDGTQKNCLTCNHSSLLNLHIGNPAWHSSGDYIVFQSQTRVVLTPSTAKPGSGIGNNLFLMDSNGTNVWQLTNYTVPPYGVLHPVFSHNGTKLLWTEFVETDAYYGVWRLQLADFAFVNETPTLTNIISFQPGSNPRFMESSHFSLNDSEIIFVANPELQAPSGFDVYTINLASEELTQMTFSPLVWDEFPHYQPQTGRIFYVSNLDQLGDTLKLDLWSRNDTHNTRVTSFHNPNATEYLNVTGSGIQDYAFDSTGNRIAAYINTQLPNATVDEEGSLYLLTLD